MKVVLCLMRGTVCRCCDWDAGRNGRLRCSSNLDFFVWGWRRDRDWQFDSLTCNINNTIHRTKQKTIINAPPKYSTPPSPSSRRKAATTKATIALRIIGGGAGRGALFTCPRWNDFWSTSRCPTSALIRWGARSRFAAELWWCRNDGLQLVQPDRILWTRISCL